MKVPSENFGDDLCMLSPIDCNVPSHCKIKFFGNSSAAVTLTTRKEMNKTANSVRQNIDTPFPLVRQECNLDIIIQRLCVPKTSSAVISRRNHLTSVDHVRTVLLRPGRFGLAIQVEEPT